MCHSLFHMRASHARQPSWLGGGEGVGDGGDGDGGGSGGGGCGMPGANSVAHDPRSSGVNVGCNGPR